MDTSHEESVADGREMAEIRDVQRGAPPGPDPRLRARIVESAIQGETSRERWVSLRQLVHQKYRYCTMFDVHVTGGAIVSCKRIQRGFSFAAPAVGGQEILPDAYDPHWQALEDLCLKMGEGAFDELKFADGRPVRALAAESGRRFKDLVRKHQQQTI